MKEKNNRKVNKRKVKDNNVISVTNDLNVANTISSFKSKTIIIITFFLLILLVIRIGWIQFVRGNEYKKKANDQQTYAETIIPKRGSIYDSTGVILATSYDADNVVAYPNKINEMLSNEKMSKDDVSKLIDGLSTILGIENQDVSNLINSESKKVTIAKSVTEDKIAELKKWISENKYSNYIATEETNVRYYPYSTLASNLIGFYGTDKGLSGIEYSWDSVLTGTTGKSVTSKDAQKWQIANTEEKYIPAENGYNLTLSIDVNIQTITEKNLKEAIENGECRKGGVAIVMDPYTGDILAMCSYPDYDLNSPYTPNSFISENWEKLSSSEKTSALYSMWRNKCIANTYEPGSLFKTITAAVALEEDIIEVDTPNVFNCVGYQKVADKVIRCTGNHKLQSLRDAYNNSCNPAFIQLGTKIGAEKLYKYYDAFGFFTKTGIALSGESPTGLFFDLDKIRPVELATMAFGQRITITPLQLINAISALVNGGKLMEPRIVKSITNVDTGEITNFNPVEIRQVVSKETSDTIKSMMFSEVEDGTGKRGKVTGYSVGGKTGTSEPSQSNLDEGYIASFIGVAPIEDTKAVVLMALFDPPKEKPHQGAQLAAPYVSKIFSEILPYLGAQPNTK